VRKPMKKQVLTQVIFLKTHSSGSLWRFSKKIACFVEKTALRVVIRSTVKILHALPRKFPFSRRSSPANL
ncbi:MAG: hypothetical protein AAB316_14435, partial [Bacteroidota bacterium]